MKNLLIKLPKKKLTPKFYLNLPEITGVYIYFKENIPIYVGKAKNLKSRVSSYFRINLEEKTQRMIKDAEFISYIKVDSELEALLLEAKLIRLYMPKYNIAAKDDKNPLYIIITKEKYPRILTARKPELKTIKTKAIFGPFPSSTNVRTVLKMIRKIFPYSDHKLGKKLCLYSQIGLCDPCPNLIENTKEIQLKNELTKEYLKNIRNIKSFLNGNIKTVGNRLKKEMTMLSKKEDYEKASIIRDKINRILYITSPSEKIESYIENPNLFEDLRQKELRDLKFILSKFSINVASLNRIECYDVSHLQGTNTTASMVTFIKGSPDKSFYRHFKIYQKKGQDDYNSLKEVAKRRKKHLDDWGKPDLIVVDGGKGQMSVFLKEFSDIGIPVIGLAKRFESLVIPIKYLGTNEIKEVRLKRGNSLNLVQRLRDEAHRFARVYHHKLVMKSLFER